MTSRCARTIAGFSLLGGIGLTACGEPLEVVPPTTTVQDAAGQGIDPLAGDGASTTLTPEDLGTAITEPPVTETLPSTTTTTAPTTTTASTTTTAPPPATAADASLAFVNQKRAENGQPALALDPELVAMAQNWAQTISGDGNLRHNPDLGTQAPDHYMAVGENVGYAGSAATIDNGWWNSPGHRENILRPVFTAVGIAFVEDASGTIWGVQVFAGQ